MIRRHPIADLCTTVTEKEPGPLGEPQDPRCFTKARFTVSDTIVQNRVCRRHVANAIEAMTTLGPDKMPRPVTVTPDQVLEGVRFDATHTRPAPADSDG